MKQKISYDGNCQQSRTNFLNFSKNFQVEKFTKSILMRFNLTVIYLLVSLVISSFICIYAWRHQQARGTRAFAVACFTSIFWMSGDIIGRLSYTLDGQWLGELVRHLGVASLPVALLVFIYRYCGKETPRRQILLLSIIPCISWLVLLTNPWHLLFFSKIKLGVMNSLKFDYGDYFWFVYLPYGYGLMAVGFIIALYELSRASRHHRKQIFILLLSLCVPFAVNIIGVFRLVSEFSYTSLSFPAFFMIMAVAIFRCHFLVSNPIAYKTVFQTLRDGVIVFDQNNTVMDINPAAAKGLGRSAGKIIGQSFEKVFEPWEKVIGKYQSQIDLYDEIELNMNGIPRFMSISITPLRNSNEIYNGRIFTIRDITTSKQHQISLETLAFHDPLTRLANRRKFAEEVEIALEKADESGENFAILYFDLNHFKLVNDTLGHETGDEFLKYVAARVASVLRKPDLLARVGGDEFVALLHNCDEAGIEVVLERLLENVRRPFKIGEHTLIADLSVGAAFYPVNGTNLEELMRFADSEMYRAKQNSRKGVLYNNKISVSESKNQFIS